MRGQPSALGKLSWLLLSLIGLSGCIKLRDTKACRAAVHTINPALDEIEALSKAPGVENQQRIARRYAELAARLKPLIPARGGVSAALGEYATILSATDTAIRAHASAIKEGKTGAATEARRELERLVRREKSAATRIDAECRS